MKTKIFSTILQLNNTPLEHIVFDSSNINERYVLIDDVNEERWKINIKMCKALKITHVDCTSINYMHDGGDFPADCFEEKKGFPVPQFKSYIMEVQDSKWMEELKLNYKMVESDSNSMEEAKHFLVQCYDMVIEIIAWDLQLEKLNK